MLLFAGMADMKAQAEGHGFPEGYAIELLSSPDLVGIARTWVDAYTDTHPGTNITTVLIPEGGLGELIREDRRIMLVSQNDLASLSNEDAWHMVVGRDVIVPVMNRDNPYRDQLVEQGISPEAFACVYTSEENPDWGMLLGSEQTASVNAYAFDSPTCLSYLAEFMETEPELITAKKAGGKEDMLDWIREDPYAIGFCRLSDMVGLEEQKEQTRLCLVPVDLNGNGKIDPFENIYACTGDLSRGIWIGKYPRSLYSRLYMVSGDQPAGEQETAFLEWVITDGQQYLAASGYSELVSSERLSGLERVKEPPATVVDIPVKDTCLNIILIVIGGLLAGMLIFYLVIRRASGTTREADARKPEPAFITPEGEVAIPGGLFFDKTHTWVFMEKEGNVRVGIDDFLQHVTGRITRVELKRPGDRVRKGEAFLSLVQDGKKLDIRSPLSGVVKAHNQDLAMKPDLLNNSPYSEGWVYKVEPANWLTEIHAFIMGDKYREWIKTEFLRLKEFLSSGLKPLQVPVEKPLMQDGGAVRDGVMEYFGPEAWEEFQSRFLDRKE